VIASIYGQQPVEEEWSNHEDSEAKVNNALATDPLSNKEVNLALGKDHQTYCEAINSPDQTE
jgi:hypothetical protein